MARRSIAGLLALLLALAGARGARAEDPVPPPPAENAADGVAREALEAFRRDVANEDADRRLEAVVRLAKVPHPDVAGALLDLALQGKELALRAAAFRGLTLQRNDAKALGPRIARFLAEAAAEIAKARKRWDFGILLDKRTGEVDVTSAEGLAALRAKRDRGRMLAEAVRLLGGLEGREKDSVDALRELLPDGNDDLVVRSLGLLGKWKDWSVLPDILELFEMYPDDEQFTGGAVAVDTGAAGTADEDAAKRRYNAKYGDPDRRRSRPRVVAAIGKALLEITGTKFDSPAALREYLKRPDVRKRVRGR